MQTFDQHLFTLITAGTVTEEAGMRASTDPHDLRLMLQGSTERG